MVSLNPNHFHISNQTVLREADWLTDRNQRLYSSFFKELVRVLKPGGKAVLLTSERELMKQLFQRYSSINMRRYLRIDLLGVKAYIYVIDAY